MVVARFEGIQALAVPKFEALSPINEWPSPTRKGHDEENLKRSLDELETCSYASFRLNPSTAAAKMPSSRMLDGSGTLATKA